MTLKDHYREAIAGLNQTEREPIRREWHAAARHYLHLWSITSDPLPPFTPDAEGHTVKPYDPAWLCRTTDELIALYRATKKRPYVAINRPVKPL